MLDRREVLSLAGLASLSPLMSGPERATAAQRPADRRRELYSLMGDLPDRQRPIGGKKRSEEERDGYILETWDLDLNGIENVPACLARPLKSSGRAAGSGLRSFARRRLHDRQDRNSSRAAATCNRSRMPRC